MALSTGRDQLRYRHHLVQRCRAAPGSPGNNSSSDGHESGKESGSALCEHHLGDIRAQLKAKPSPNYLPNLITATFPGTALVGQTPLAVLSGMGSWVLLPVFPKLSGRGAASLTRGHEGSSSSQPSLIPSLAWSPGPEDTLVLSPGMLSAPAAPRISPQPH